MNPLLSARIIARLTVSRQFLRVLPLLLAPFSSTMGQALPGDTLEYRVPFEVTVTAPGMGLRLREMPFATSIVGRETVRDLPRAIGMDEPLKLVPGVKVDNQANGSRVHCSVRGQGILTERGIRGIKTLLDGIPLNDPTGFAPDFFDIDYGLVARMEVLRGPAASLYGGSGAGGVINVVTEDPPAKTVGGAFALSGGSNGFLKTSGWLGGSAGDFGYRASYTTTAGDGYRDHSTFRGTNVGVKAPWVPAPSLELSPVFQLAKWYHENPEGINLEQYRQNARQANPDAIPYNEFLETDRTTVGLTGTVAIQENHRFRFAAYAKRTRFVEANNRTFNHRRISTPGLTVQYDLAMGGAEIRNRVTLGADLGWQTIDERRTENNYGAEGDTSLSDETISQAGAGIYLIDKLDISPRWSLTASLRFDRIRNELEDHLRQPYDASGQALFSKTTGRLGVTWQLSSDLTLFAAWGQGFLPPATEELAQNPDNFGGFNSHLTFATSDCYDIGSRGIVGEFLRYEITAFLMTTENDFDRYRLQDSLRSQETFYRNAGSSRRAGLELAIAGSPHRGIELQAAYTYSHFIYTNDAPIQIMMDDPSDVRFIREGNSLPNSPRHQLFVDFQYTVAPRLTVGLATETLSKAYIDGANVESEAAGGYTLLNARLVYALSLGGAVCVLRFNARNVADTQYVAFTEPDPGGNSYQGGPRREFFLGAELHF